jgi:hypothetical protein
MDEVSESATRTSVGTAYVNEPRTPRDLESLRNLLGELRPARDLEHTSVQA